MLYAIKPRPFSEIQSFERKTMCLTFLTEQIEIMAFFRLSSCSSKSLSRVVDTGGGFLLDAEEEQELSQPPTLSFHKIQVKENK